MRIHFIAIGGAAMHNLALALNKKGFQISGSDDEIYEPSRTRLKDAGILPDQLGWFPDKINSSIDAVILGMHARMDNPELVKAQQLGLKIYSYPEFVYESTKDKTRIVVGGSHGKTTVTSMIMHVLKKSGMKFDYLVGSQIEGFDLMVGLSDDANVAVIEGDEYLASPIDRRPKFHLYHPQIAIVTGIAWDHINVFPTFENYVDQFRIFIEGIPADGHLVYCATDEVLVNLVNTSNVKAKKHPYNLPENFVDVNNKTVLVNGQKQFPLDVFGNHNLLNIQGAGIVANQVGIETDDFYTAIQSFKGAAKRLELVFSNNDFVFYRDFAHSPSKLKATTDAFSEQFSSKKVVACMELHTFSSLNENFLKEYAGSLDKASQAIVYFNPQTIAHKKLKEITIDQVKDAFNRKDLIVFTATDELKKHLKSINFKNAGLLMMSSGTFDGIDFKQFAAELNY